MKQHPSVQDELESVAGVAAALRRAGLQANSAQIAEILGRFLATKRGLEELRQRLDSTVEPAVVFSANAWQPPGGSNGN